MSNDVHVSKGNIKVACPIVNFGAAHDCPSAAVCPFSMQNYKTSGKPLCYAYKAERYPSCLKSRRNNETAINAACANGTHEALANEVATEVAKYAKKSGVAFVRFNEASDICEKNLPFALALIKAVIALGVKPYTYSKAPQAIVKAVRDAGCVVQVSEVDFVCVKSEAEAAEKGLKVCPGIGCGEDCIRCCVGAKTAVVAH